MQRRAQGLRKKHDWSEWTLTHGERLAVANALGVKYVPAGYLPRPREEDDRRLGAIDETDEEVDC